MRKAYDNYNDYNDVSLVDLQEKSTFKLTFEILSSSFNSILPYLLLTIIDFFNLYFLGSLNIGFNYFQIGVIYLNLFCFILTLGVVFTYEPFLLNAKNVKLFYETYLTCKDNIILLFIILILPISLLGYPILAYYFDKDLDSLWLIYTEFLIYSSLIILFNLLLLLNVKILHIHSLTRSVYFIVAIYLGIYLLSCWLFLFRLSYGIYGLTLSLLVSALFSFLISHLIVTSIFSYFKFGFSNIFSLNYERMKNYLYISTYKGFFNYLEYAGYGLLVLSAYHLNENSFTTNLVIFNIISIPHVLCEGFANSIRSYLLHIKTIRESYISRKKYIICFVIVVILVCIIISGLIYCFSELLPGVYNLTTYDPDYTVIINMYCFFIFFDYLSIILDGYIKGKEFDSDQLAVYKGIILLLIFVPLGLFITIYYSLGLFGIWMTIYLYMGSHFIVDLAYVYTTHGLYGFKE
jgi:Na+-driven multidrug efflux pump